MLSPTLGDLTDVDAGFETPLGKFKSSVKAKNGSIAEFAFNTPDKTSGDVVLPGVKGNLVSSAGEKVKLINGKALGIRGGDWYLEIE